MRDPAHPISADSRWQLVETVYTHPSGQELFDQVRGLSC